MELVDYRGERLPLVRLPGGALLLGMGTDGTVYLKNPNDEPYLHGDAPLFLNPHFRLAGGDAVEMMRNPNGTPMGMAFHGDERQDFVDPAVKESLYADLAGHLSAAVASDGELLAHLRAECARADLRNAVHDAERAAEALVAAGRELLKAQVAAGMPVDGDADGSGPVVFVVAGIPEGDPEPFAGCLEDATRALARVVRGDARLAGAPVALVCGEA